MNADQDDVFLASTAQRAFMRLARSLSGTSVSSGTMISALRPREVSFDATRAEMSRLNEYSRKHPSGLRLPGVSEPWPGSRRIVIVLLVLCLAAHRIPEVNIRRDFLSVVQKSET